MVLTSRKNAARPKGQAFEASHEDAQVSSGTQKAGWMRNSVSILHFVSVCWFLGCVLFCEKRLKCVQVNRSERLSQSYTSFCYKAWVTKVDVHYFLASMSTLIERTPPPRGSPGGFPICYVPSSRTVCKRTPSKHLVQILRGGVSFDQFRRSISTVDRFFFV